MTRKRSLSAHGIPVLGGREKPHRLSENSSFKTLQLMQHLHSGDEGWESSPPDKAELLLAYMVVVSTSVILTLPIQT